MNAPITRKRRQRKRVLLNCNSSYGLEGYIKTARNKACSTTCPPTYGAVSALHVSDHQHAPPFDVKL